jgi:serine/threonine-protein kinase
MTGDPLTLTGVNLQRNFELARATLRRGQPSGGASLVGVTVDRKYTVKALIGRGGMSDVYEAEHRDIGKAVAIKVLHRERAGDRRAVARLAREARVVATLQHSNICQIYDLGRLTDGRPFLVMDRLHGETLGERLDREGTLSTGLLIDITVQLLTALVAVHRVGVIHRDLKPDNIFLETRSNGIPTVKLLDFGVAQSLVREETPITIVGNVAGTPVYMAPEQIAGKRPLDARVDIWATGVVMYEALAGHPPFWSMKHTALVHQIMRVPHRSLLDLDPSIRREIAAIVDKALAKDADDRHTSAQTFRDALVPLRQSSPPRATRERHALPGSAHVVTPDEDVAVMDVPHGPSGLPDLAAHDTTDTSQSRQGPTDLAASETRSFFLMKRASRRRMTKDGPPLGRTGKTPATGKRR